MADKSDRDKDRDIRLSETQMRQPGMRVGVTPDASRSSSSETSELAEEYSYVAADLRRIGGIALVMLAGLVALALLLP